VLFHIVYSALCGQLALFPIVCNFIKEIIALLMLEGRSRCDVLRGEGG
jgi:hypothetical protein